MYFNVAFADQNVKEKMGRLENSSFENGMLLATLNKAIEHLSRNAFSGTQVQKRLIPRTYVKKYNVNNLWKFDLSGGWRLLYFVISDGETTISVIVDWMSHKEYERLFHY